MGMANRTTAERVAELEADRVILRAALAKAQAGVASLSVDGMAVSYRQMRDLRSDLIRVNKSLQRLYRGGRGIVIDMSQDGATSTAMSELLAE